MMHRLFFILLFASILTPSYAKNDSIISLVYQAIGDKEVYAAQKEEKLLQLQNMFNLSTISDEQLYGINQDLVDQYKNYLSDSAILYAQRNIMIAQKMGIPEKISESVLDLASLYIITGLYIEAKDMLANINNKELPDHLKVKYYDAFKLLYTHNAYNNFHAGKFTKLSGLYRDSLLQVLNPSSNHYKIVYAEKLYDLDDLEEAKAILKGMIDESDAEDHEKAVLAYALGNIFKKEGNREQQEKFYALSAICDIRNAIMENASMQALASTLYENGNIEGAYRCIRSSMEDAMFCNARLRSYEVSQIFPIIDSAYQKNVNKQKLALLSFLIMVSILSLFLIVAVIYVYKQMKRVARIRKELYHTNIKLNSLNGELQQTNGMLQDSNRQLIELNKTLSETNEIKETYIGHFLDMCSMYIRKLEKFQVALNKKAREKKLEELYKMLKSNVMIEEELKELNDKFDNIFLHLYPNFVEEFNSLLLEEERFVLKPDELLNAELRIFALIRLGITDTSKIAAFLHYSTNTIYNYRTRIRNRAAVPREEFDQRVMKIGKLKNNH